MKVVKLTEFDGLVDEAKAELEKITVKTAKAKAKMEKAKFDELLVRLKLLNQQVQEMFSIDCRVDMLVRCGIGDFADLRKLVKQGLNETLATRESVRVEVAKYQETCTHDWALAGNDSHYDYRQCIICDLRDKA